MPLTLRSAKASEPNSEEAGISCLSKSGSCLGRRYLEGLISYDSALQCVWRREAQLLEQILHFLHMGKTFVSEESCGIALVWKQSV